MRILGSLVYLFFVTNGAIAADSVCLKTLVAEGSDPGCIRRKILTASPDGS